MSLPLKAQGEFAPLRHYLEAALNQSLAMAAVPGADHDLYAMLVDAAAERRDPSVLQQYAARAREAASGIGHRMNLAIAERAVGVAHTLAGEYSEAEERFQAALELFNTYPAPWQIGRTLFELGELSRARGDTRSARQYFARALDTLDPMHAEPYAARCRLSLSALEPD